ncbi:MAG: DUF5916 domain-containing protein [Cyclobacteriaceae bacterium]
MRNGVIALVFWFFTFSAFSQVHSRVGPRPSFKIYKATSAIELDGALDEDSWKDAVVMDQLMQQFPYDTSASRVRTEFRMTHDDQFIYIGAIAYDNNPGPYVISSLRRDFRGPGLDGLSVIFDPFQDLTNGFFFGLSPAGVQREGLISNGYLRGQDLDLSWDNKWYGETTIHDGYWVAEFAIPFKTLRFKSGSNTWNIKLYRQDSKENERAVWPWTPRNFELGNLNYTGVLEWDQPPQRPSTNISIIPYLATALDKDFVNERPTQSEFSAGGDAKIAVTSSLNLDLTFNPDFSQVEVDRQVTNLNRFEIFFPERRQFFLENADLFSSYGHPFNRPFFTRRIGVARDTLTGVNVQNKIIYGARLSGNLNQRWRVGFLNMQTAAVDESNIPSYNYTVATTQRRIGSNSNIRAIFVNRQQFKVDSSDFRVEGYDFNRVLGADYNYSFLNNKITGSLYYHKQFTPEKIDDSFTQGFGFLYSTQNLDWNVFYQIIGQGYDPAVGFTPRNGFKRVSPSGNYRFFPASNLIINHGPNFDLAYIWDDVYGYTDHEQKLGYGFSFQNSGSLNATFNNYYTYLFRDFDPTNSPDEVGAVPLPDSTDYNYSNVEINYRTDPRKVFNVELRAIAGEYFNGTIVGLKSTLNYRIQPYGVISMDFDFNRIQLPEPYQSADIYLVGPRLDLTLSRSVFFTTFFQYNSQFNNLNINSRFQWRFKPVSDLFIVYTDNYFYSFEQPNQNFSPKVRSLVVKLTYWFNM